MGCGCNSFQNKINFGGRKRASSYSRNTKTRSSQSKRNTKKSFSRKRHRKNGQSKKKMRGGSLNLIGTHPVSDLANVTSKITGYPYVNSSTLFSSPYTAPNSYVV